MIARGAREGKDGHDRRRRGSILHEVLRWAVAVPVAAVISVGLLLLMSRLIDGSWILEALTRVFPLEEKVLTPEERCELETLRTAPAVTIEGTVGTLAGDRFVPLEAAEIHGEGGIVAERGVAVDAGGRFRFVTALPGPVPPECGPEQRANPQLVVDAPGCEPRRVPVTNAWVSRRIVLSCGERG